MKWMGKGKMKDHCSIRGELPLLHTRSLLKNDEGERDEHLPANVLIYLYCRYKQYSSYFAIVHSFKMNRNKSINGFFLY